MNAEIQRHPIRGALWGLLFGVGLYFLLVGRKVVVIGSWLSFVLVMVVGIAINVLWSLFGPARGPRSPDVVPTAGELPPEPPPLGTLPPPTPPG